MKGIYKRLGQKIKRIRQDLDLTQENLEELSGVGVSFISKIETGTAKFSLNTLTKITDALNISLSELFDFSETPKINSNDIFCRYLNKFLDKLNEKHKRRFISIIKNMINLYSEKYNID